MASNSHPPVRKVSIDEVSELSCLELCHVAKRLLEEGVRDATDEDTSKLYHKAFAQAQMAVDFLEYAIQFCHTQSQKNELTLEQIEELNDLEAKARTFALGIIDFAANESR